MEKQGRVVSADNNPKFVTFVARLGADLPKTSFTYNRSDIISVSKAVNISNRMEIETRTGPVTFYFDSKNGCTRTHRQVLETLHGLKFTI